VTRKIYLELEVWRKVIFICAHDKVISDNHFALKDEFWKIFKKLSFIRVKPGDGFFVQDNRLLALLVSYST
jgi:hypothetical protein